MLNIEREGGGGVVLVLRVRIRTGSTHDGVQQDLLHRMEEGKSETSQGNLLPCCQD